MALNSFFSPNGFSVGNLFNPTNVVLANGDITAGNSVTANYFLGNGAFLTGISAGNTTVSNTAPVGAQQGDIWIQGNTGIQYIYFTSDGNSQWAEMEAAISISTGSDGTNYTDSNVAAFLPTYIGGFPNLSGNIITTANISGVYLLGNITQSTGYYVYDNSNVANYLPTYTGNLSSGAANLGVTNITGNLVVSGNISASGNLSYFNVTDLVVDDPLIFLAANATGDVDDIGLVGSYDNGNIQHTGLARDYTDGQWKLFDHVASEPNTVIAWNEATYANLVIGNIIGNIEGISIGFRSVPQTSWSGTQVLALSDSGRHLFTSSGGVTAVIPTDANAAFPIGTLITLVNRSSVSSTCSPQTSAVSLYFAGNSTIAPSSSRTIGSNCLATILKIDTNTWMITGAGVS